MYSIKQLEDLSGVKKHTIRIWEKRYNLLKPKRTQTDIRYYADEELKKLLNVCTLIKAGMKISRIGKLSDNEIAQFIKSKIETNNGDNTFIESMINNSIVATSVYDEQSLQKIFLDVSERLGTEKTYTNFIYPLLVKTGVLWNVNNIMPAQEHFLSNFIKQKIHCEIGKLPYPQKSKNTWLLYLNSQEEHEMGLLFAFYILKKRKEKVIYLGTKVPDENIESVIKACKPNKVMTFFVKKYPDNYVKNHLGKITSRFPEIAIYISGVTENFEKLTWTPRLKHIQNAQVLCEVIDKTKKT